MSYCRWSSDDFKCDIYCYESETGYEVHVASKRVVGDIPAIDWISHEVMFKTYKEQMKFVETAERENIGLPYDGESFSFSEAGEAATLLEHLKGLGYSVPHDAIDALWEDNDEKRLESCNTEGSTY